MAKEHQQSVGSESETILVVELSDDELRIIAGGDAGISIPVIGGQ